MKILFYHAANIDALVCEDGIILETGSFDTLRQKYPEAETHDFEGATVYPGFADTHLHILNYAITHRGLELGGVRSKAELLTLLREKAKTLPEGEIIQGRGFNEDLWDDNTLPTADELECGSHPVRLVRVCGHMELANRKMMERMGIDADTAIPEGGTVDIEKGIFTENAIGLLYGQEQDEGVEKCKELLHEGMCAAAKSGLTALFTDDLGTGGFAPETVAQAYRELEKEGRMPLRIVQQCALPDDEALDSFIEKGYTYGFGSDMYRIGPRKLYADGSLGAHTAYLSEPYADRPDTRGVPVQTQESLNHHIAYAHEKGFPCIVHAIGDAAAELVLNAVDHARKQVPGTEHLRDGIVHCQITSKQQLMRIRDMHVDVYAQPVFTEYDLHICRERVGEAREKTSYNWKTLYDTGVCISSGSDCPVETFSPAANIYCAVYRMDYDGFPEGGWMPGQRLSFAEAVACHTEKAGEASEMKIGRLEKGYLADMTVYAEPLETMKPEKLIHAMPKYTVVGGKTVMIRE